MTIFAVLSIVCLSVAVLTMVGWAFVAPRPVSLAIEDTAEEPEDEPTAVIAKPVTPKWPYEGRHRRPERLIDLTDTEIYDEAVAENRERDLLATAATPVHPEPCGYPDVIPCICPATPADWFGVPNDDTRQLTAVK